jgi:hypothetical protein
MIEIHKITEKESFDNYLDHKDDLEYKYSIQLGTDDMSAVYYAVLDDLKEKNLINNYFYENQKETISFLRGDKDKEIIDIMCFLIKMFICLFLIGLVVGFVSTDFKQYELKNNTFIYTHGDF